MLLGRSRWSITVKGELYIVDKFQFQILELVLRDNQLKKILDVTIFKTLLVFDVSFNEITSMSGLSNASTTLKELYVSKNEVTKIEEIEHFHELQILELVPTYYG
ncbi:hypothetical protein L1887_02778 [Cichorium endivia]|nr:hypothetical protein L1887_02778 [Cichorium endivia]